MNIRYFRLKVKLGGWEKGAIINSFSENLYSPMDKEKCGAISNILVENSPDVFEEVFKCEKCGKYINMNLDEDQRICGECYEKIRSEYLKKEPQDDFIGMDKVADEIDKEDKYTKIKYETDKIGTTCLTQCLFMGNRMVGLTSCVECPYNISTDETSKIVICSYDKKDKPVEDITVTHKQMENTYERIKDKLLDKKEENNKLKCPVCKSENIENEKIEKPILMSEMIYGSISKLVYLLQYNLCKDCGIMFQDVRK